jgi:3-oxoacyl-[acyl-carrier protein] reductase
VIPPLRGRVAVVTGAGRGIGAKIAVRLGDLGASVVVNYLNSDAAAADVVAVIRNAGGCAIAARADVRISEDVDALLLKATDAFGEPDTLVLNADVGGFIPRPLGDIDAAGFIDRIRDELLAAITPVRAMLPSMIAHRRGCVVAISSALCRAPAPEFSLLAVSKSALETYMRCLAVEAGPQGVRANIIEASMVETDNSRDIIDEELHRAVVERVPLGRLGTPGDIADATALMCTDLAGFITGATIPVNGGQVLF